MKIIVREMTDRYNARIPARLMDAINVREGEQFEVEHIQDENVLIVRKFNREATA